MTLKRPRDVVDDNGLVDVKLEDEKRAKRAQDALTIDLTADDSDEGNDYFPSSATDAALRGLNATRRSGEYSFSSGALKRLSGSMEVAPSPASTASRRLSTAATPRQRNRRRTSSSFLASLAVTPGSTSRSPASASRHSAPAPVATPGASSRLVFGTSPARVPTPMQTSTAIDVDTRGVSFQTVGDLLKAFDCASAQNMRASRELNYNRVLLSAIMQLFYKFFDGTRRLLPDLKRDDWADVAVGAYGKREGGFEKFGSSYGNASAQRWFAHLRDFIIAYMPREEDLGGRNMNAKAVKAIGIEVAQDAAVAWESIEGDGGGGMLSWLPGAEPA